MFAGIPGIGVGTLFYVLTALWMPFPELIRLMRGRSSAARWRLIAVQFAFATSIISSIALAERALIWALGADTPASPNPARLLNEGFTALSPESIFAAPIIASLILLGSVVLTVEALRLLSHSRDRQPVDFVPDDRQKDGFESRMSRDRLVVGSGGSRALVGRERVEYETVPNQVVSNDERTLAAEL
jgi:hypothetical protein